MSKTHYRKVFKSDHLGLADIEEMIEEGKSLVFTITQVKSYIKDPKIKDSGIVVAGKRISANIAFFKEGIKPLVLNATNSGRVRSFNNGSVWVEDWSDTMIELCADSEVKMKGEKVGGVRIMPIQPKITPKEKPHFTTENFEKAKAAGATLVMIKSRYSISKDIESKYLEYVS